LYTTCSGTGVEYRNSLFGSGTTGSNTNTLAKLKR
jgi:hypothetical protein